MKFSDYYLSPAARFFATLIGLAVGGITSVFYQWQIGALVGAGAAILASFLLPLKMYLSERPYAKEKEKLKQPFLFDERVQFSVNSGMASGFFILTENNMVFLSLGKEKHTMELCKNDVQKVLLNENFSLSIYLNDKDFIRVVSGASEEMFKILRTQGWKCTF